MTPRVGETFPASVLWADGHGANILSACCCSRTPPSSCTHSKDRTVPPPHPPLPVHSPAVITWMATPAGAETPVPGAVLQVMTAGEWAGGGGRWRMGGEELRVEALPGLMRQRRHTRVLCRCGSSESTRSGATSRWSLWRAASGRRPHRRPLACQQRSLRKRKLLLLSHWQDTLPVHVRWWGKSRHRQTSSF